MFDMSINDKQLRSIADEFEASENDLRRAYGRALGRTATRMRTLARKALREGLDLRSAAVLKARLRMTRQRARGELIGGARLWVGTNDMPLSHFKGRPKQTAAGVSVGGRSVKGAFLGRNPSTGGAIALRRLGSGRLPVETPKVDIQDEADAILEREVFDEIQAFFFNTFRAEVRARTIYGVGG